MKKKKKKKRCANFRMAGHARLTMCTSVFSFRLRPPHNVHRRFFHSYLKKTKKIDNQFLNLLFEISLVNQNSHVTHVP